MASPTPTASMEAAAPLEVGRHDHGAIHTDAHDAPGTDDTDGSGDELADLHYVGAYRLVRLLGRGGMGQVFLAERDGRSCALKLLHPRVARREEYVRRFDREGHLARRLDHPNIVRVREVGVERGRPYIVMEHVAGSRLVDVLRGRLPLTPSEALAIVAPIARAVAHAHSHGILHRDIKPENVLLDAEGQPKLIDFGLVKEIGRVAIDGIARFTRDQFVDIADQFRVHLIELLEKPWLPVALPARLRDLEQGIAIATRQRALDVRFSVASLARLAQEPVEDASRSHGLTGTGECLGTPLYMSPEQFAGVVTDGRTDLYSLGVLYYLLVTGRHPWIGDTLLEIGKRKLEDTAPDPCALNPDLPRAHAEVIMRLVATAPAERYPSARFLLEDLERLKAGESPLLEAYAWWEHAMGRSTESLAVDPPREEAAELLTGLWHEFLEAVRIVRDGGADFEDGAEHDERRDEDATSFKSRAPCAIPAQTPPLAKTTTVVDSQVFGGYLKIEELGRNAQGIMYRAEQASTGLAVALWVFATIDRRCLRQLRREARGAARLTHRGLIPILELGQAPGPDGVRVYFAAMPWTEGRTLAASWEDLGRMERVRVLRDIARTLGHAHQAGLSHRNLGLSSIRLPPEGPPLLLGLGFSLASDLARVPDGGPRPTSLHRAAPEQLGDLENLDGARVDVWALGVILYEILAGTCPFARALDSAVEAAILTEDPPPLPAKAPADLVALCIRALRKSPAERPGDGESFAVELDAWLTQKARRRARRTALAWRVAAALLWGAAFVSAALFCELSRR